MLITFDTSGFQPRGDGQWENPETGDYVSVSGDNGRLTEPVWLDNLPALRRQLAHEYAEMGCLIEADLVRVGNGPEAADAAYQLAKTPIPNAPHGGVFIVQFMFAKQNSSFHVLMMARETGTTGVREALLAAKLGMDDFFLAHPYDPQLKTKLPFSRADDPAYDAQFPQHPLSRARAWARGFAASAAVNPSFAALPPFYGAGA
jgi:hypothetical protein